MDFLTAPGRAIGSPRGRWTRGAAALDGDFVVVRPPFEEWHPVILGDRVGPNDPIVRLAAVRDGPDAVAFATQFGSLWAGDKREPVTRWIAEAAILTDLLGLYRDVQVAIADPTRADDLWTDWDERIADLVPGPQAQTASAFVVQAATVLVDVISNKLAGVQERLGVWVRDDHVEAFVFDAEPPDLLTLIYHQFALLVTRHAPIRSCADPRCGQFFTLVDTRQRFCSKQHATRARVRKMRAQEGDRP